MLPLFPTGQQQDTHLGSKAELGSNSWLKNVI